MEFSKLLQRVTTHYDSQLPFVIYSPSDSDEVLGVFQKDDTLHTTKDFSQSGFVFAPFSQETILMIPYRGSDRYSVKFDPQKIEDGKYKHKPIDTDKTAYLDLVGKTLQVINNKGITKIVTSRKAHYPLASFDISQLINRVFHRYPGAFRYVWFHPSTGIWVGATPEVLLKVNQKEFSTMALAGTQPYVPNKEIKWGSKEIVEQQLVTNDIAEKLQKVTAIVKVSKTKNHRAGSLVHLRTDFTGIFTKGDNYLLTTVKNLHPTPAICGTPRDLARSFIVKEEGYDREFYTGYLGPVDVTTNSAQLFVNLRCMKIANGNAYLYVGGGITSDSIPRKEWEETQHKMQTMLQVIGPMLSH